MPKGFTLLELLITIVVFAFVILSMMSSFNAFTLSSRKVKEEVENKEKISFISQRISQDFEALFVTHPPQYKPPEFNSEPDPYRLVGIQENQGQKTVSSIYFSSLAYLDMGAKSPRGVVRITYYLRQNDQNSFDLFRSESLWPFSEEIPACQNPMLFSQLSSFDILYVDHEGEEHTDWDSESENTGFSFPQSIKFNFTAGSKEQSLKFSFTTELPGGRSPVE